MLQYIATETPDETKTENGRRLDIYQEQDTEFHNPRNWDNATIMACSHRDYMLGDKNQDPNDFSKDGTLAWKPLYLYDHSGITMSTGDPAQGMDYGGWDTSLVGVAYITKESLKKTHGDVVPTKEELEKIIDQEVETYDQFLTGDVWSYTITNEKTGEEEDGCGGFFGIESIYQETGFIRE